MTSFEEELNECEGKNSFFQSISLGIVSSIISGFIILLFGTVEKVSETKRKKK